MTGTGTKILKPEFCEVSEDIFADASLISFDPCFQPKGGFKYVFEWKDGTDKKKVMNTKLSSSFCKNANIDKFCY